MVWSDWTDSFCWRQTNIGSQQFSGEVNHQYDVKPISEYCAIYVEEMQPLTWRAWANVAWDSVRVVGLCFICTIVKMQGPNKPLNHKHFICDL